MRKNKFVPRQYYAARYESTEIDENTVLYESRDGAALTDSPLALFLELAKRPELSHLRHIWVVLDSNDKRNLINIPAKLRSDGLRACSYRE